MDSLFCISEHWTYGRFCWCLCVCSDACQHPPESRAAPTPHLLCCRNQRRQLQPRSWPNNTDCSSFQRSGAYLNLLHYFHLYAWDFHFLKISLPRFLWRQKKNESAESYFHLEISSFLSNYSGGVSEYFISDQEENPKIIFSLFRSLSGTGSVLFITWYPCTSQSFFEFSQENRFFFIFKGVKKILKCVLLKCCSFYFQCIIRASVLTLLNV